MSRTRWIFRGLLLLVVVGLLWAGYRSQIRNRPDYYWSRAQAAVKADNLNLAEVNLRNLVQKFPSDPRGHQALATVLVKKAKLPESAAGYAAHPAALSLLSDAGRLNEGNLDLQKLLLAAQLQAGRAQQAGVVAARVAKAEPNNADAVYARAWKAGDDGDVNTAFKLLDQMADSDKHSFRVLGLRAQILQDRNPKDPRLAEVLDAISERARQLPRDQVAALSDDEFAVLLKLLPVSVAMADGPATAYRRAEGAINVCEGLAVGKTSRGTAIANMSAQIAALLTERFGVMSNPDLVAARQALLARLEKIIAPGAAVEKPNTIVTYEAAQLAFNKGDYATALALLNKALDLQKADQRAKPELAQPLHLLAARTLMGMRRPREAKQHLASLLEDKQSSGQGQLMLGAVAASEGRYQDALALFTRAEREMGNNPLVTLSLAQTLLALGKWEDVLPYLSSLHELLRSEDPEVQAWIQQQQLTDPRIHFQEARALLALRRPAEAEKHLAFVRGTEIEPQAIELQAESLLAAGQQEAANKLVAEGLARFPKNAGLINRRVALLQQAGKADEAQAVMAAASAAAPDDLLLQLSLARQYTAAGRHDEALKLLTALEAKVPDSVPVLLVRADALIQAKRLDEAAVVADRLQKLPAGSAAGSLVSTMAALQANDPKRAAQGLQASGDVAENLQLRHLQGEVAAISGDYRLAIAALGESVGVTGLRERAGPMLCYSVGKLAAKEGAVAAEKALAPVFNAAPDEPFVLMAQSDVLNMQGKFNDALRVLDRLEGIDKDSPYAPQLKAAVLGRLGDNAGALKEVNRALARAPAYLPSLATAAQLHLNLKQYQAAIDHAQLALNLAPAAWQLAMLKSEAEWAAGRPQDATATLQQLAQRMPDLAEVPRQLVILQTRAKQYEAALATCRQAREKFKDDLNLAVQEVVLLHRGGQSDASEALARQLIGNPVDAAKASALAVGFAQLNQYAPAARYGQAVLAVSKDNEKAAAHQFLGNLALTENAAHPERKLLEMARGHFAAVLELAPNDFVAGNNLAYLLAVDFGRPAEAVRIAERARGEATVDRLPLTFVDTMAVVYRRAGELPKAAVLLEQALAAHPSEALIKFHLGMTLGQLGNLGRADEAKQMLADALKGTLSPEQVAEAKQEVERISAAQAVAAKVAADAAAAREAAAIAAAEAKAIAAAEAKATSAKAKSDKDN